MTHTPEPWKLEGNSCTAGDEFLFHPHYEDDQSAADIARAVKCVNALAGIPNPEAAIQAAREALQASVEELQGVCALADTYGTRALCAEAALASCQAAIKQLTLKP